jgi:hypothetical protein
MAAGKYQVIHLQTCSTIVRSLARKPDPRQLLQRISRSAAQQVTLGMGIDRRTTGPG